MLIHPIICNLTGRVCLPFQAFSVSNNHMTAKKQGSDFQLKSPPTFLPNAGNASFYFVVGKTETNPQCPPEEAYTGFVVDKHWLGVNVGQKVSFPSKLRCVKLFRNSTKCKLLEELVRHNLNHC